MSRSPFILDGRPFDLSHLAPCEMACRRLDEPDTTLMIDVTFSHHTYTSKSELAADHLVVEKGDARFFDVTRWQLSRDHLPGMLSTLPNARVQFTPEERNYRYALATMLPDGMEYALFFSLRRSEASRKRLRMVVESAYPIEAGSRVKPPGHIRFGMLALQILRNGKARPPPRR